MDNYLKYKKKYIELKNIILKGFGTNIESNLQLNIFKERLIEDYINDSKIHIHTLRKYINQEKGYELVFIKVELMNQRQTENELILINPKSINISESEKKYILNDAVDWLKNFNGNYELDSYTLRNGERSLKIIFEVKKIEKETLKGGNIIVDCDPISIPTNFQKIYSSPEEDFFEKAVYLRLVNKMLIIKTNGITLDINNSRRIFIEICEELCRLIGISNNIITDKADFISLIPNINPANLQNLVSREIPTLFKKYNKDGIRIVDSILFSSVFTNKEDFMNDISSSYTYLESIMDTNLIQRGIDAIQTGQNLTFSFPNYDDIENGRYHQQLEIIHLLIPDNSVVHNGIYKYDTIEKIIELLGKSFYVNLDYEKEVNFIHSYLHKYDALISSNRNTDNHRSYINRLEDILNQLNQNTLYCFHMLVHTNRYDFLRHSTNESELDEFILTGRNYTYGISQELQNRKDYQNGHINPDGTIDLSMRKHMLRDQSIRDADPVPTRTKLYPLNDPFTSEILNMGNNITNKRKFKRIKEFFDVMYPKITHTNILTDEIIKSYLESHLSGITKDELLLYLRYFENPERYNINWII